jgi:phosphohistidine swiveling domain-containing protein
MMTLQEHKSTNWQVVSKRGRMSPFPNMYSMEAVSTITKNLVGNINWNRILLTFQDRDLAVCIPQKDIDILHKDGLSFFQKNPSFFTEQIGAISQRWKTWNQWLQEVHKQEHSQKTDQELIDLYFRWVAEYKEIYGRYFPALLLDPPLSKELQRILSNKCDKETAAEVFTKLTFCYDAMHPKHEERDRLHIALAIQQYPTLQKLFALSIDDALRGLEQYPAVAILINQHVEKYFWITRDYEDPVLTKEDVIAKLYQSLADPTLVQKAEVMVQEKQVTQEQIVALEQKYLLTDEEKTLFKAMRDAIHLKELRKKMVSQALYYFDPVLEEIGQRAALPLHLVRMLHYTELVTAMQKKNLKNRLEQRYKESIFVIEHGHSTVYEKEEAKELIDTVLHVDKNVTEIKGISGSAGIAKGPVRIILHPSDFDKVQEGDIMVTLQAVPSFIEPLRKCQAIIADGGCGITSHPATLAREVGIPCVLQTKIATEVFEDGDIVEVDGNSGTVTLLERNRKESTKAEKVRSGHRSGTVYVWETIAKDHHSTLARSELFTSAFMRYPELLDLPVLALGGIMQGNQLMYIYDKKSWVACYEALRKKIEADPGLAEQNVEKGLSAGRETNKWTYNNIFSVDLTNKTNGELFSLLKEFMKQQGEVYVYGVTLSLMDFQDYSFVEGNLKRILEEHVPEDFEEYYRVFTNPPHNSFLRDQELSLLHLMEQFYYNIEWRDDVMTLSLTTLKEKYPLFAEKIADHTKRFCWTYYVFAGPAFTEENFVEFIRDYLRKKVHPTETIISMLQERRALIEKRQEYLEKLRPTGFDELILRLAGKVVWGKPRRKDHQSKSYYHAEKLQTEIGVRLGLTLEQVRFTPTTMLENALVHGRPVDTNIIQQHRDSHVTLPQKDGSVRILYGDEAQEFLTTIKKEETSKKNVRELKGMCACAGDVTGTVRIVNHSGDMEKMEYGDILVSIATTPAIVTAMKKAGAIVTDEGGLTCHASIVSRELNIPCVVGTKIATKVFKDGDVLHVDASKGIVRRI